MMVRNLRYSLLAATALSLGLSGYVGGFANAQDTERKHVLNLNDVEVGALIDDVAMLTGYTFIKHGDVRGTVSVSSQTPLSSADVFRVFLSTLRVNGFSAIPDGRGVYRIVPSDLAAGEARLGVDRFGYITEVFAMQHFNAVETAKLIKPLLRDPADVVASPTSNILIVTEHGSDMQRIRELVEEVDRDRSTTETVSLQVIRAADMAEILRGLNFGNADGDRSRLPFSALPVAGSNSIILKGDNYSVARAMSIIGEVDTLDGKAASTRVFKLKHSRAVDLEAVVQQVAISVGGETGGASISIYEPSNSLIVSAGPEALAAIGSVLSELDVRPVQVHIEALLAQVTDGTVRDLGVQFALAGTEGNAPLVSSTFSGSATDLLGLTGALANGFSLDPDDPTPSAFEQAALGSLLGPGINIGGFGQSGDTLFGAVINAIDADEDSVILSTPSIFTLNNRAANLSIGQEIPITSGEVLGDANVNPFRTVERRDIGVILTVTPSVGDEGTIQLEISQEVSSIDNSSGVVTDDFILSTSSLNTNIEVIDGEMRALGGLIQTSESMSNSRIPVLGDIPGVGLLFRSESSALQTTSLMLFIRATIIDTDEKARDASNRTYQIIRNEDLIANDDNELLLDGFVERYLNGEGLTVDEFDREQSEETEE